MNALVRVADDLKLPESPRWHGGQLWFSDIVGCKVWTIESALSEPTLVTEVPHRASGTGWSEDGHLLVVSQLDCTLQRLTQDGLEVVADLSPVFHANGGDVRPNDMLVDATGRCYIGSASFARDENGALRADESRPTPMARVDPDGSVHHISSSLRTPNGILVTPDGGTLVVAETRGNRLTSMTLGAHGDVVSTTVFADLEFGPDGICMDVEGAVWAAFPFGHRVMRVAPGGQVLDTIDFGERLPTACTLGGASRTTLYITSVAAIDHSGQSSTGRIDKIEVAAPGCGLP